MYFYVGMVLDLSVGGKVVVNPQMIVHWSVMVVHWSVHNRSFTS